MKSRLALALTLSLTLGPTMAVTMPVSDSPALAATHPPAATPFRMPAQTPTFGTVMVHIEQAGTKINPSNPSLTQVRLGQTIRMVMYVRVASLTQPAQASATLTIRQGGKQVFYSTGTFTVNRSLIGGSSSGWMWFSNNVPPCSGTLKPLICLPPVPGRYRATGIIRMGGQQGQQTTVFTEQ